MGYVFRWIWSERNWGRDDNVENVKWDVIERCGDGREIESREGKYIKRRVEK